MRKQFSVFSCLGRSAFVIFFFLVRKFIEVLLLLPRFPQTVRQNESGNRLEDRKQSFRDYFIVFTSKTEQSL